MMIRKLLVIFFVLLISNSILGQVTEEIESREKSNPIIYLESFGGFSVVQSAGFAGGFELNYQTGKSLFTARYTNAAGYSQRVDDDVIVIISRYDKTEDYKEYAVLYGIRWLRRNHSYSISAGISRNNLELISRDFSGEEFMRFVENKNFYSVPFEANYKWFYSKKKSKLVYYALIPSVGLKLFGNIGKYSFAGVGITLGLGLNKKY